MYIYVCIKYYFEQLTVAKIQQNHKTTGHFISDR